MQLKLALCVSLSSRFRDLDWLYESTQTT